MSSDSEDCTEIAFDRSRQSFYRRSIVTIAVSCFISDIRRDIGQKSRFFIPNAAVK